MRRSRRFRAWTRVKATCIGHLRRLLLRFALDDHGRSGWFMLIALIPLVGIWLVIDVGFISGERQENPYGRPVA